MSKRFGVSGVCASALVAPSSHTYYLLGKAITTGRTFWLKTIWVYVSSGGGAFILQLFDDDEGGDSNPKPPIYCAEGETTKFDFGTPGLEFRTNCVAGGIGGTVGIGRAGGNGYEVG